MVTDGPAVLILVLSHRSEPFRSLEAAQRATWMGELPPNVRVLHYRAISAPLVTLPARLLLRLLAKTPRIRTRVLQWFGGHVSARSHDGSLKLNMPDVFHLINAKTMGALRYVAEHESFDYIYRVNSSAYVDVPLLLEWLGSLPRHECYAGSVIRKGSIPYVMGAGIALSRDLVGKCARAEDWNYSIVDDRAFGLFMDRIGVDPIDHPHLNVESLSDACELDLDGIFLFRCRGPYERSQDLAALEMIHQRVMERCSA